MNPVVTLRYVWFQYQSTRIRKFFIVLPLKICLIPIAKHKDKKVLDNSHLMKYASLSEGVCIAYTLTHHNSTCVADMDTPR